MRPTLALVFVLTLLAAPVLAAGNRDGVAVIIGNSDYKAPNVPDLSYAGRDADAMKRFVLDVLGYDPANVIDLRDATKAEMEATFGNAQSFKGRIWRYLTPGASDVLVYYSGHGVPNPQDPTGKKGYLLPSDGDPEFAGNGYPVDQLLSNLKELDARTVTVLLDACFSGAAPSGARLLPGRKASFPPEFSLPPGSPKGPALTLVTAASGTQTAFEDPDARHGLLTKHLLRAFYGEADGVIQGGRLTLGALKNYLARDLRRDARRRFGQDQEPTILGPDDTVLVAWPGGRAPTRPADPVEEVVIRPPNLPRVTPQPDNSESRAKIAFQMIANSTDSAAFDNFIDQYPSSSLVCKAIDRAAGLIAEKMNSAGGQEEFHVALRAQRNMSDYHTEVLKRKIKLSKLNMDQACEGGEFFEKLNANLSYILDSDPLFNISRTGIIEISGRYPSPRSVFRDCADCPEMVVIPRGEFVMGSPEGEAGRDSDEGPQHVVRVEGFAAGRYEVTQSEWDSVMGSNWSLFKGDRNPVERVSWDNAQEYVKRLSAKTGKTYRLLTESEWEYAARGGRTTAYWWGASASHEYANYGKDVCCSDGLASGRDRWENTTSPVGSFPANPFGLYDMHGNVYEWVEDCYGPYSAGPTLATAVQGNIHCKRVLRGGTWIDVPGGIRSASRIRREQGFGLLNDGVRVARTLP